MRFRGGLLAGASLAALSSLFMVTAATAEVVIIDKAENYHIVTPDERYDNVQFRADGMLNITGTGDWYGVSASTTSPNTGTINFNGTGTSVIGGFWGTGDNPLKAVNINSSTVSMDVGSDNPEDGNGYDVKTTTVASGATLGVCSAEDGCGSGREPGYSGHWGIESRLPTIKGDLLIKSGGTLDMGRALMVMSGNLTFEPGSVIKTTIAGDGDTGARDLVKLHNAGFLRVIDGAEVTLDSVTVAPDISTYSAISNNARYIFLTTDNGVTVKNVTATNTGLYTWRVLRGDDATLGGDAKDVYLIARKSTFLDDLVESLPKDGGIARRNVASVASVMNGLANSDNVAAQAVNTQLSDLASSTPAAVQSALKSMAPDVTGGAAQATTSAATAVSNVISSRSDAIRLAMTDGQTGIATGDALRGLGVWVQPFGFHAVQGMRKGIDGYDVNSGGLAAGIDTLVTDRVRAGLALSYGRTGVDGRNDASGNSTDIDSYQATLYGSYQGSPWYVDAQIGYGYNQYDGKRRAIVGTINEMAKGDFDGKQFSAKLGGGYPIAAGRFTVTPNASLSYIYLDQDSYSESNAPILGLNVSSYSTHSLKSGLGSKLSTTFDVSDGKLTPEVSGTWQHEFHDTAPTTAAQFAFGGSSFRSQGAKQEADAAVLGVGLTYTKGPYSISAQYDAELKSGYVGQTGLIKARIEF